MLDSVQPLLAEHASLQEQLSDAAVHQNPALAKKLNRRYAEVSAIVSAYHQVVELNDDLAATKNLQKKTKHSQQNCLQLSKNFKRPTRNFVAC
jgi:peptide chain release factor 1